MTKFEREFRAGVEARIEAQRAEAVRATPREYRKAYEKRPGRPGIESHVAQRIRELRAQGLPQRAIAQRVGVSQTTVSVVLRREASRG